MIFVNLINRVMKKKYFFKCNLTFSKKILFSFFALLFVANSLFSQEKPFSIRYQDQFKGNIVYVSNNSLSKHKTNNYNDATGSNDFAKQVHVDIDNNSSTFNSSTASLSIPTNCSSIAFAGLYWSGTYPYEIGKLASNGDIDLGCSDCRREDPRNIKFKLPGATDYIDLVGTMIYDENDNEPISNQDAYACFSDVTSLISNNASGFNGAYTVANIRAAINNIKDTNLNYGTAAGWTLVIIYKNDIETPKNFTVYDGFAYVNGYAGMHGLGGATSLDFTYSEFQTVPSGQVKGSYGIGALEGDRTIDGSFLQIKNKNGEFVNLTDGSNPSTNFFNSTISQNGSYITSRNPYSTNTLGYDADLLTISAANNTGNSLIKNNQTSATFRANSNSINSQRDAYFIFLSSFAIEVYKPDVQVVKTMQNSAGNVIAQGSTVQPNDVLTYKVSVKNYGNDNAQNVVLTDLLPFNTVYDPSNLVTSGLKAKYNNGTIITLTTAAPSLSSPIQYIYDSSTNKLTFNVFKDLLNVGAPEFLIYYNVKITDDPFLLRSDCGRQIKNQIKTSYKGTINTVLDIKDALSASATSTCGFINGSPTESVVNISNIQFPTNPVTIKNNCPAQEVTGTQITEAIGSGFDISKYKFYTSENYPPNSSNQVSLPIKNSGTYYAIRLLDGRFDPCYDVFKVIVVIDPIATKPTIAAGNNNIEYCQGDTATALATIVTGENLVWYANATGGAGSVTAPTLNTTTPGSTKYYVSQKPDGKCESDRLEITIKINPLPTATITGTTAVCVGTDPLPKITFTGAGGTAPYTFTYQMNTDGIKTITSKDGGNSVTENVSTGTAGTFTYTLISVSDSSTTRCSQLQTGSAVVTVNPSTEKPIFTAGATTRCQGAASKPCSSHRI